MGYGLGNSGSLYDTSTGYIGKQVSGASCRPDYEGMIARANEQVGELSAMQTAMEKCMDDGLLPSGDGMDALVGFLSRRIRGAKMEIERMIREQERHQEK